MIQDNPLFVSANRHHRKSCSQLPFTAAVQLTTPQNNSYTVLMVVLIFYYFFSLSRALGLSFPSCKMNICTNTNLPSQQDEGLVLWAWVPPPA